MSSYKCDICHLEFKSKFGLDKHTNKKNKCNIITDYQCDKCLKYFRERRNLTDHKNKDFCKKTEILNLTNKLVHKIEQKYESENNYDKIESEDNNDKILRNAINAILNSESINTSFKIDLLKEYNLKISEEKLQKIINSDIKNNDIIDILLSFINKSSESYNNINQQKNII